MTTLAFLLASLFDEDDAPVTSGEDPSLYFNTNIAKLLIAICGSAVQPIEDCLRQLLDQRSLETAIGAQLDAIGVIVGQPRIGLDDDTYRRYLRATIATHRSRGTVEDLLRVISLVIFDDDAHYAVLPQPVATVLVRVLDIALTDALAQIAYTFLARSAATGIRIMLEFGESPPAQWFTFDTGPGFNQGHLIGRIDHL